MSDLVSVIVPIYNVEDYLRKCVDAAINQTYKNLEIILVDDGTKDSCGQICDEYAKVDSRIKVVHKENGGLSSARNAGLDVATGRYVMFYDSDDYIELNTIEKSVEKMKEEKAGLVAFNIDHIDEKGNVLKTRGIKDEIYSSQKDEQRFEIYIKKYLNYRFGYEAWNKLYDLDIIRENNLRFINNYKVFAEDICFLSFYLQHVDKIVVLSDVFYHYLVRDNSIMGLMKKGADNKFSNFVFLLQNVYNHAVEIQNKYMTEHFYIVFATIMHNRYMNYSIPQLIPQIHKLYSCEYKDFFMKWIIEAKKHSDEICKYCNNIPLAWPELGNQLQDESVIGFYSKNLITGYLILPVILIKKAIRKIKRKN